MKTITAEQAMSLSIDNNSEFQERKKQFNEALESCMVKIYNAAKVGSFRTKCYCKIDLLDEIAKRLNEFGYEMSLDGYSMSSLSHREQGIQSNMIEFEVIWK
jgi:PP-loop superfamily ATP-utilizing enzyme